VRVEDELLRRALIEILVPLCVSSSEITAELTALFFD